MPDLPAEAAPASFPGGPHGALVIHGFTSTPQSVRGLAEAFASAGFATELPLLPGHGTAVEDLRTKGWADWSHAVEEVYLDLAKRCDKVVVAGLSLGGTLASWLAATRPEIAGAVLVNPAVEPMDDATATLLRETLAAGTEYLPAIAGDIAEPGQVEVSYDQTPIASLLTLVDAQDALDALLADIRCPVLLCTSPQDHVVAPSAGDHFAARVAAPVERVTLERSYHVATLDHDRHEIERRAVEFAAKVVAS